MPFEKASPGLIDRAKELYTADTDDIEIDDQNVNISRGEDDGTWVAAWVWVPDEEPQNQPICSLCDNPQWETPSGLTCCNGHGGAPSKC